MTDAGTGPPALAVPDKRSPRVLDPAPARLIGLAAAAGLVLDVGLHGGVANLVVTVGVLLVVFTLVSDGRLRSSESRRLVMAATVPAAFLAVRSSPWLAASNMVAIGALVAAAVSHARTGSVLDTTPRRVLGRCRSALVHGLSGLALLRSVAPPLRSATVDRVLRVARATMIALPILAVVVVLLASGDAVFASLVVPGVDVGPVVDHAVVTAILAAAVLCVGAAASDDPRDQAPAGRFGATEVTTMLLLTTGVLCLFVVSQLVALTDAGRRLVESSGLTPAEYARSGFFQLCWATALLVIFLALVRALAAPDVLRRRSVRLLGGAVPLLATGLVVVSLRRMALYDRAFGLTMLRLWVIGAALWMGALLIMIALRNIGVGKNRNWVVAGAGTAALALVLTADLTNPEAFVVRHNITRTSNGAELDVDYLSRLSDDAVPAIARASLTMGDADGVGEAMGTALRCHDHRRGVASLNLASARAAEARRGVCPG